MEPQRFGQYRLESLLGSGGMGEVYRAYDERRDRVVALKLLPTVYGDDVDYQKRFRRESHVLARLREPHVVPIHDYGEIDGRLYIDMRLVDGRDVSAVLADEGRMAPERVVRLVGQVAEALDAAHADGLVHRDIKPSNVLVTASDFVYVVDFGVAHAVGHTHTHLTMTGTTVGTLDYMAPERFTAARSDHRVDVYALACLLFECLTGHRPFTGTDLPTLMFAHLNGEIPRASEADPTIPAALDDVVACGMSKRPEERYDSAGELAAAARRALTGEPAAAAGGHPAATSVGQVDRSDGGAQAGGTAPATRASRPSVEVPAGVGVARHPPPREADRPTSAPSIPTVAHRSGPSVPLAEPVPGPGTGPGSARGVPATPSEPMGAHPSAPSIPTGARLSVPPPPVKPGGALPTGTPPPTPGEASGRRRARWILPAAAVLAVLVVLAGTLLYSRLSAPDTGLAQGPVERPQVGPVRMALAIPSVGPAVPVGPTPGFVEVAPNGRAAYVANREAGIVTVLDTTVNQVTATIPIPQGPPQYIGFSPDGSRAYVTIYNKEKTVNLVAVLDTASNEVLTTVPVGTRPFALAVSPDQRTVVVPSHDTGKLDVIDAATNTVVREVPVAPNPHWVAFSPDGRRIYTANHESNVVSVLDASTFAILTTIPVGTSPHSTAVSPDGRHVAVVNFDSNELSVIDTGSNAVVATVPVGSNPQDVAWFPDGRYVYTANVDGRTISVVDTTNYRVTATIPVGQAPTSISVRPDGSQAYVTDLDAGTVRILDVSR